MPEMRNGNLRNMELKRREFLGWILAAGAGVLCCAWAPQLPGAAARQLCAVRPGAYPGPVVALDRQKIRTQAIWLG